MKNRNFAIETVKGIAIILVIGGHVIQHSLQPMGEDFFLNPVLKTIYTFHMPLFICISGYLMAWSVGQRNIVDVFKNRCKSLLIPCVVWGILGMLTNYVLLIIDGQAMQGGNLFDQLISKSPVWYVWFLWVLFLLSCLLLYSIELEKKFGILAFVCIYLALQLIPWNQYGGIYYVQWFYLFFLVGYFINKYSLKINSQWTKGVLMAVAGVAFFILVMFWVKNDYIYINQMHVWPEQGLRLIYRYIVAFLGIFFVWNIGIFLSKIKAGLMLVYIGGYALDIYLIQRYLVEGLYPRWIDHAHVRLDSNSPLFFYIFVPLVSILFIFICILISNLLIRRSDLLNRLLLGGRSH